MLKSLVNVQMNSAVIFAGQSQVQWLMFRGIQHLLEIEINLHLRRVCVKSKFSGKEEQFFYFIMIFSVLSLVAVHQPEQTAALAAVLSAVVRGHEMYIMTTRAFEWQGDRFITMAHTEHDSHTTSMWNSSQQRLGLIFISYPEGGECHSQEHCIDLNMITQQDLHSHYRIPAQTFSSQDLKAAIHLKYNEHKFQF